MSMRGGGPKRGLKNRLRRRRRKASRPLRVGDPAAQRRMMWQASRGLAFDGEDPWDVLGLDPNASWDEISTAHKSLAREHHPDLPEIDDGGEMARINVAFTELKRFYERVPEPV